MFETMNTFLQAVKEREHIHPLIQQADLRVSLLCDQHQPIQLVIKNGEIVTLLDSESTEQPRNEISGNLTAMEQLLEGKERLRVLERNSHLKVTSSLRTTLLLESIFYLTKAQNDFAKIV
jgi:hypothetical protein